MKQNVSKIKRIALTTMVVACAFSSIAAISASAETYEKLDKTVNGKHIYALAERYSGYSKISASSYSGPTEIKIFMESQQKNSSGKWIYPNVETDYSTSTSKSKRINAQSGYSVVITYGTVKFGGVGTYQMYKR